MENQNDLTFFITLNSYKFQSLFIEFCKGGNEIHERGRNKLSMLIFRAALCQNAAMTSFVNFRQNIFINFRKAHIKYFTFIEVKEQPRLTYTTYSSDSTMIPSLENTTSTWRPSIVCWRSRSRELKNSRQKIPKDLRTVAVPSKALSSNYVKYDKAALTQVMINALSTKTVRS